MNGLTVGRWCSGLAVVVLSTGCLSMGGVQRADTLGKGNFQVAVEPGAMVVPISASTGGQTVASTTVALPMVDFAGRFGVTEGIDLGIRAGTTGIELQGKFLFTKPGDEHLAVSFAPTFGGVFLGVLNYAALNLPLLIGFKFGPHELTLGPRLVSQFLFGGVSTASAGGAALMPGASVGFAAQIGELFTLIPEFTMVVPVYGSFALSTGMTGGGGAQTFTPLFQFKLGLAFGKNRAKPAPPAAYRPLFPNEAPPPPAAAYPPPPAYPAPPPPPGDTPPPPPPPSM